MTQLIEKATSTEKETSSYISIVFLGLNSALGRGLFLRGSKHLVTKNKTEKTYLLKYFIKTSSRTLATIVFESKDDKTYFFKHKKTYLHDEFYYGCNHIVKDAINISFSKDFIYNNEVAINSCKNFFMKFPEKEEILNKRFNELLEKNSDRI